MVCEPTAKVRTYKESAGFHFEIGSFYFIRGARVREGIVTVWGDANMQLTTETFSVTEPLNFM